MFMQWNFKTPSFFRTRSKRPAQRLSGGRPGRLHLGRGGSGEREAVVTREGREGDRDLRATPPTEQLGTRQEGSHNPPQHHPAGALRRWQRRDAGSGAGGWGRDLRPSPRLRPPALPPVKGRRSVGRSRPREAPAKRPPSPRYLWPRSRRSTCCPPPSAVWRGWAGAARSASEPSPDRSVSPCRRRGGGPGRGRAGGRTALAEPGKRGHLAPLGPQADSAQEAAAAAAAGTWGGAAAAEAAPTCPASSPGPPHAPPQTARGGAERAATSGRTERWTLRVRRAARAPGVSQGDSRASFPLLRRDCRLRSLGTWKWKRFCQEATFSCSPAIAFAYTTREMLKL